MHMEMFVCVYVWWLCGVYSGCVLGSGSEVRSSSPTLAIFLSSFPSASPSSTSPVQPVVIGYLAFAGVQIQDLYSQKSNGPGGTSGAHSTCCEEDRPILQPVLRPSPGALLA